MPTISPFPPTQQPPTRRNALGLDLDPVGHNRSPAEQADIVRRALALTLERQGLAPPPVQAHHRRRPALPPPRPQSPADQARAQHLHFSKTISKLETKYLDLGLEYHALPLQLRDWFTADQMKAECEAAFCLGGEGTVLTEMMGYISDLRQSRDIAKQMLQQDAFAAMRGEIDEADDTVGMVEEELEHLAGQVRSYTNWHAEMVGAGFRFRGGNELRLAMREEDGADEFKLLRDFLLGLPEVKGWLDRGIAQDEDEAFDLAVTAPLEERIVDDHVNLVAGSVDDEMTEVEEGELIEDEANDERARLTAPTPFNSRRNTVSRARPFDNLRPTWRPVEVTPPLQFRSVNESSSSEDDELPRVPAPAFEFR